MQIKVFGEIWHIIKLPESVYDDRFGKDSRAVSNITHNNKSRAIYFRESFTKQDIIHELTHVYLSYSEFGKPSTTLEDNEEIICLFMEDNLHKIISHVDKIYKALKQYDRNL